MQERFVYRIFHQVGNSRGDYLAKTIFVEIRECMSAMILYVIHAVIFAGIAFMENMVNLHSVRN